MPMLEPIRIGTINKLTINALLRTAARYSRAAMTSILRMVILLWFRRGDAHEDFVQRWLGHLKMADLASLHQIAQNLLRIRIATQPQFLTAAKISYFYA